MVRAYSALHSYLYRLTGGRLGGSLLGVAVLMLETRGRRTGEARRSPVYYVEDGGGWVVVASNFGRDVHPAWYVNVRADPHAIVHVGSRSVPVIAREATDAERERLWPRAVAAYRQYEDYRRATDRRIPLVILRLQA